LSDEREAQEPMDDPRLHDFLDGRLPPEDRARLERELAADPLLSDRLRELRALDAAIAALPGHAAPPDFTARVVRAARKRRLRILRLVMPLAGVAAAVLLVVFFARTPERPAPAQDAYLWEWDHETYGSLALTDLEDQILEELEGT
jgi:anti-sigma factor RsiW